MGLVRSVRTDLAPEVVEASRWGPACDMWAAGVTLHFALSGTPPFDRPHALMDSVDMKLTRVCACEYDRCAGEAWAGVSVEAKDLVQRLLVVSDGARLSARAALTHPWLLAMRGPPRT